MPPVHTPISAEPVANSRLLRTLTREPAWAGPRWIRVAVVCAMVAIVGAADYFSGTQVTLRVFYEIPIALAVAWLGRRAAVAVSLLSIAVWLSGDYLAGSAFVRHPRIIWNAAITWSMYLVLIWVLGTLITLYRELEDRVRRRTAALEREVSERLRLQRELVESGERERNAIGHELHDGLCQHLVGTALAAQVLSGKLDQRREPAAEDARGIVRLVEEGIAQTRQLARGLLLARVAPERLAQELEELAARTRRQHAVACEFKQRGPLAIGSEKVASNLFRIAQEAVRNALRHAHPRRLEITLDAHANELELAVLDDGVGVAARPAVPGMGLRIMAHRAESIGGTFRAEPAAGGGTRVSCRLVQGAARA